MENIRNARATEIVGGRYDGDYRVTGECPSCGGTVTHILERNDHGPSPRLCNARCGATYDVRRPGLGVLGFPLPEGPAGSTMFGPARLVSRAYGGTYDGPPYSGPGLLAEGRAA